MKAEAYIANLVNGLTEDSLFIWTMLFKVDNDHSQWLDDEWPDKLDDLRTKLTETMIELWRKESGEIANATLNPKRKYWYLTTHYRRQVCGDGYSERTRVFVKPKGKLEVSDYCGCEG